MRVHSAAQAVILIMIIALAVAFALWGSLLVFRERPGQFAAGRREKYGAPPGMVRAIHHDELGYRGWADAPGDYQANTASAISHMIMRSA